VNHVFQANTDTDIDDARTLFKEYETNIGVSLCFQNFEQELANLPGDYAPPNGRLLLAKDNDQLAGCIALRQLVPGICEMKRLFVRPAYQGTGLGRILVDRIIDEARKLGYTHIRLDTMPGRMDKAIALYRSIGFVEIAPYYVSPVADATFMELKLVNTQE
jgi:ribosomal protein S18 acetylase RimI-like enzyme